MKKIFINTLLLFSLLFSLGYIGANYTTNPLLNWGYYYRFVTFPRDKPFTTVEWYKPAVIVKGAERPVPFTKEKQIQVSDPALQKAASYAESKNSTGLLILHNNKIILENYWNNSNSQSLTDSASMGKSIVAMLIGIAINEGKIKSVDEPAANYLPEWRNDSRNKISIKHLLQMSSGLRNFDSLTNPLSDLIKMHIGFNINELVLNIPAINEPGLEFDYNNANSQILGLLLQRATGVAYQQYLSEKLWQPLGASAAKLWLDHPDGVARTYCCHFISLHDWGRLGQMLLNGGKANGKQIIPAKWLKEMLTPSENKITYGYQIWIANSAGFKKDRISEPFIVKDMFFLDGKGRQRVYIMPSEKLVAVRVGENASEWDDALIPNTLIRGLKKVPLTEAR